VSASALWQAIDVSDHTPLPPSPTDAQLSTERWYLAWLAGLSAQVEGNLRMINEDNTDTPVTTTLKAMFPASQTRTRLIELATRNGARAEVLFGFNFVVQSTDISAALKLP